MNRYGDIGKNVAGWYSRMLLSHAMPVLVLERFSMTKRMPRNVTDIIEFNRPRAFAAATVPLTEGVTPPGSPFGYDKVTALLQQFGDWSGITDVVQDVAQNRVMMDMKMMQGEQIGLTRELLTYDVIKAGTNVWYGGGKSTRSSLTKGDVLDYKVQRRIIAGLRLQKAREYNRILGGSENYATYPVEGGYFGVCHTNMESQIRDLKGANSNVVFRDTAEYARRKAVHAHELGTFEKVRYILSPDLNYFEGAGATPANADDTAAWWTTTVSGTAKYDVYPVLFLGREAFGCVVLRGRKAVIPMVLNPGTPRGGDQLGQRGSIGWKMWFCCVMLNEAWMARGEFTCPY